MARRRLAAVAALAALALCAPATARADDCAGADVVPAADNVAVVGQATLCLLNQQRAAQRRRRRWSRTPRCRAPRRRYSQRMVAQGFFAHESPDGGDARRAPHGRRLPRRRRRLGRGREHRLGPGPRSATRALDGQRVDEQPRATARTCSAPTTPRSASGWRSARPPTRRWGATYTTDFGAGANAPAPAHPRAKAAAASAQEGHAARRRCARAASAPPQARARRSPGGRPPAPASAARDGAAERLHRAVGRAVLSSAAMPLRPPHRRRSWPSPSAAVRARERGREHAVGQPARRGQALRRAHDDALGAHRRPAAGLQPPVGQGAPRRPACACSPRTSCPRSTSCSRAGRTTPGNTWLKIRVPDAPQRPHGLGARERARRPARRPHAARRQPPHPAR